MKPFDISMIPMYVCLFWSILLLIKGWQKQDTGRFLLSAIMLILSFVCLGYQSYYRLKPTYYPIAGNLYLFAVLLIFPLFSVYIDIILCQKKLNLNRKLRFVPAFIILIYSIVVYYFMTPEEGRIYVQQIMYNREPTSGWTTILHLQKFKQLFFSITITTQIIAMILYGFYEIKYRTKYFALTDSGSKINLNQFRRILYLIIINAGLSLCILVLCPPFISHLHSLLFILPILYALSIFLIGYWGFKFNFCLKSNLLNGKISYKLTRNDQAKLKMQKEIIALLEEEEVYTRNGLKVNDIAIMLCSNRTYVSDIINTTFKTTFTELINKYRLEHAKRKLLENDSSHLSITQVRKMSGFSSDSSFYRIFKEKEGITPIEFKNKHMRN